MASKGTKGRAQADPILHREVVAICRLKKRATTHGKAFLADIVQIGKRLSGVKDRVGHGNWLPWLHHNFDWSGETAANYMAIFRLSKTSKFQSLKNLPLEVLYLLGRKTVSEETRNTIVAHFEGGEKVTIPVVKKLMKIPAPMYSVPKVVSPKLAVKVASPKYVAPIDYESTQSADIILEQVRRLATSVADKFAVAGDVAHIADRVPVGERETLIQALDDLQQFALLLKEALGAAPAEKKQPADYRPPEMPELDNIAEIKDDPSKTRH